jgi:type I restriction enzyme S subunit
VSKEPKLPTGWVFSTIGEVCEPSQYGYTAKASSSGRTHYLRTTDITSGLINWASVPYCDIPENEEPKYLLNDGDVVISRAGSVGFSCLILNPAKSVFASYLIRFRPLILPKYFSYFLNTPAYWESIGERSLGIAVQNVNATNLSEIQIPIAPKAEQTRIVEKLEELFSDLDAGVTELKAAQKKLAQYRQSLLKAAVEGALTAEWRTKNKPKETGAQLLERILKERRTRWEEKQLAKFKEQGKTPPKGWQDKYPEPVQPDTTNLPELPEGWVWASVDQVGEVFLGKMLDKAKHQTGAMLPYLRNISVRWGSIETHDLPEMYFEEDELERYGLASGDVLVCEGGEPGRAAVCGKEHEELKYQKALHRVRLFSLYESDLLVFYLEHLAKTGMLEQYFTGSTIKHFTKESFIALPIPLPPICEQSEIVEHLKLAIQCAQEQDAAIIHSLTQAAAQRKNILKSAFSGQLVPQDPNDEPASLLLERIRAERQKQASTLTRGRKRLNLIKSNKYVMR